MPFDCHIQRLYMLLFDADSNMREPPEKRIPKHVRSVLVPSSPSIAYPPSHQDPIVSSSSTALVLTIPYDIQKHYFEMCFIQVKCHLCLNQECGRIVDRNEGTVNVCEGQEVFHRTGDVTALEDCSVAVNGTPDKIPYHAGRADFLCNECSTIEARELYQQRRQSQYMNQNRVPAISTGWEEVPDWSNHADTMVPGRMFNHGNDGG
jgi:hypothetical protein